MAKSVATLRTEESADCAYVIAIEGIPYLWATNHTGDGLLGSGAGTWIGTYEAANTAHETVGQRTVLPGLRIRQAPTRGDLDAKSGLFQTTSWTFEIVDYDGVLGALFSTEGKGLSGDINPSELGARIAPGTTALASSITLRGGATTSANGLNIGLERIGPTGQRRWFWPLPEQGIGLHHQVHQDSVAEFDGPPPVPVSDDPLVFAGRMVTLWRVYRDRLAGESYTAWPTWDNYYPDHAPEWVGVMRDAGEFDGADTWKIKCHGWESLLRRGFGNYDSGWRQIVEAPVALEDHERGIGISFDFVTANGAMETYGSVDFGTLTLPASGSRSDFVSDINTKVQAVASGSQAADFGSSGNFLDDSHGAGAGHENFVNITEGEITLRRSDQDLATTNGHIVMRLCMHEKVWRVLGYEPAVKSASTPENDTQFYCENVGPADGWASGYSVSIPSDNYWNAFFTSRELGQYYWADGVEGADNGGNNRIYKAIYQTEPLILPGTANDTPIYLGFDGPYYEADPTIDPETFDAARYFVFRGKRFAGRITTEGNVLNEDGTIVDAKAEDFAQVAEVRWDYIGTQYGTVSATTNGKPELFIHRWLDPKKFGLPYDKLDGEWSGLAGSDFQIEVAPLNCWAYHETPDHPTLYENASSTLMQVLVSTGTSDGYSGGSFVVGDNDTGGGAGTLHWLNDITTSELGLGIPVGLVQTPTQVYNAFDEIPGGIDGGLNRIRASYQGSTTSWDVLKDLVQCRGLSLSLAGGKFGVVRLALFDPDDAEFSINENDTYGDLSDPRDVIPRQDIRATGPIDKAVVAFDLSPATGETAGERTIHARDFGARFRRGDLVEEMTGHCLRGHAWEDELMELWSNDRAKFLAQRHFVVETTLSRLEGQDLYPGARGLYTNRNIVTTTGARGITNGLCIVLRCALASALDHSYNVRLLVFDGQANTLRRFAPIAKIARDGIQGTTITLETDANAFGHGEGNDGTRFTEPASSSVGGNAVVCVLEWDRSTWTYHTGDTATVASATGTTVTLSGAFSTTFHKYTDKWLVMVPYDSQNAGEWVQANMLPIVRENRKFGAGDTSGFPYVNA